MEFDPRIWPSHKKGAIKRAQISAFISRNPTANLQAIADEVQLSPKQVERHLNTLKVERGMNLITVVSIFLILYLAQAGNWLNCKAKSNVGMIAIQAEISRKSV